MLPLDEAQRRLAALAHPVDRVEHDLPLVRALGRRLASPLHARRTQPAFDLSAMDGYALAAADAGMPLRLVGESAAGRPWPHPLGARETVRIFTGAALPAGADCVLIQENVARESDLVRQVAGDAPRPGRHVRAQGGDFCEGDRLLDAGALVDARAIGLAAAAGHGTLAVRARPVVAILSTGDELVPAGEATAGDRLPSSNAPMLAAMLAGVGAEVRDGGIVRDDAPALAAAFRNAAAGADVLVTSGGASVGDHDLVRPALEAAGGDIMFWRVAMRPGKPLIVGRLGDTILLGLPGNPVSAYVTALLFLLPLVRIMAGQDAAAARPRTAAMRLAAPLPANDGRTDHLRARVTADGVRPAGPNDSAALLGLARADALIVRVPHAPPVDAGAIVDVILPA